jgi:predicted RNase H-like HicB family nuclease
LKKAVNLAILSTFPPLKGYISQGTTKEEALSNIKKAIEAHIEALVEDTAISQAEVMVDDRL